MPTRFLWVGAPHFDAVSLRRTQYTTHSPRGTEMRSIRVDGDPWYKLANTNVGWLEETGLFKFEEPHVMWLATANAEAVSGAVEGWLSTRADLATLRNKDKCLSQKDVDALKKVVREDAKHRLARVLYTTLAMVVGRPGSLSLLDWVRSTGLFALDAPWLAVQTFTEYTFRETGPWEAGADFAGIPQLLVALPGVREYLDTPSKDLRLFVRGLLHTARTSAFRDFVTYVCPLALAHVTLDDFVFAVIRSHSRDLPVWLAQHLPDGVFDPARDGDMLLRATCKWGDQRDATELVLQLVPAVSTEAVEKVFYRAVRHSAVDAATALCNTGKLSADAMASSFRVACNEQNYDVAVWLDSLQAPNFSPGRDHPLLVALRNKVKPLSLDLVQWLMGKPGVQESLSPDVLANCSFVFSEYDPVRTSVVVFQLLAMLGLPPAELGVALLPRLLTMSFWDWTAEPWVDFFVGLLTCVDDVTIDHTVAEIATAAHHIAPMPTFDRLIVELGNKSLVGWSDFAVSKYVYLRRFPVSPFIR